MRDGKVYVGLVGFGTIGSGVVKFFNQKQPEGLVLKTIVDKDTTTDRGVKFDNIKTNIEDILNDPEIDIMVELIGGYEPARDFILKAIDKGKNVVTANKAVISKYGKEIFAKAKEKGVSVGFEASVGGGIPIIRTLRENIGHNKFERIAGILNGTTNYILTKMEQGKSYETALKEAQTSGFAEADPSFDVEGKDSAQKISILASLAYGKEVDFSKIYCEGITNITEQDIAIAEKLGYKIKLLALAKEKDGKLDVRVHPSLVPKKHFLSSVSDEYNAAFIDGDFCDEQTYIGKGAGSLPTASAVMSDIINIAKMTKQGTFDIVNAYENGTAEMIPMEEVETEGYIRLMSRNVPGVFGKICNVLGAHKVNIKDIYQNREFSEGEFIPDIITTDKVKYNQVKVALEEVKSLDCIVGEPFYMRIL